MKKWKIKCKTMETIKINKYIKSINKQSINDNYSQKYFCKWILWEHVCTGI